jgi:tetratricopeptide (TPR) repeat protein
MRRGIPPKAAGARTHGRKQPALSPRAKQLFDLGQMKSSAGDHEGAATAFKSFTEIRPDFYQAHFNLGRALVQLGRDREAIESFQRALTLHPHHVKALTQLANAHKRLGNLDEAVRLSEKAFELDPADTSIVITLARMLSQSGRYREAVEVYQKALEINPDSAPMHYNLGNLVRRISGDAAANPHYVRAVELDPNHVNALINLGITHRRDSPETALEYFRKAVALEPDSLTALYGALSLEQRYCDFDAREVSHAATLKALEGDAYRSLIWQTAANWIYESLFAPLPWPAIHTLQRHISKLIDEEIRVQAICRPISAAILSVL